jgi:cob(I)alamin adenosyltransferase
MAGQEEIESAEGPYYTREGDNGRTNFGPEADVPKSDVRVVASAECDEANAAVSVALALGGLPMPISSTLASVQNDLFDLVADLFSPLNGSKEPLARIRESHVERLERAVDHFATQASDLSGYVLPGGTVAAALLYQARGVVRRAERAVWIAYETHPDAVSPLCGRYLNRLSSLLFVLARGANVEHGDVTWVPEASAKAMAQERDAAGDVGEPGDNP